MKRLTLALMLISVLPVSASAAGVATFEVPGGADGAPIKAVMWTPCTAAPGDIKLGGALVLSGVKDCPIEGEACRLLSSRMASAARRSVITTRRRCSPTPALPWLP